MRDGQRAQIGRVVSRAVGQAHHHVEAFAARACPFRHGLAFEHRGQGVADGGERNAEVEGRIAVDFDPDGGLGIVERGVDVDQPLDPGHVVGQFAGQLFQDAQIGAEDLDLDRRFHRTHAARCAHREFGAGDGFQRVAHGARQILRGPAAL
ncbi:hypothetical protein RB2654_08017 [Rhodobacterales bacterium HTCC2654]|nr:hypothetical protein RB2654_08017 [Rhodobacterales bacterium HTCC2654] [Maritimibacter alkaliphilus HTCC2654]